MKFVHITTYRQDEADRQILPPGYYNWHRVFGGEIAPYHTVEYQLDEYDIILVGLIRQDLSSRLIQRIRENLGHQSKTKIVALVDHAVELWESFNPYLLADALSAADVITYAEPTQGQWLEALLDGQRRYDGDYLTIGCIPLPFDQQVEQYHVHEAERRQSIMPVIHRYDQHWLTAYMVTHDLRYKTRPVFMSRQIAPDMMTYFDEPMNGVQHTKFISVLAKQMICLDTYHVIHSYGRLQMDCACLRVPCVGSSNVYMQSTLWPTLMTEPGDVEKQRHLVKRLMVDRGFRRTACEYAEQALGGFTYDACRDKFLQVVTGATAQAVLEDADVA